MDLKTRETNGKSSQQEDAWGVPRRWGPARALFLTAFSINFSRFEVHLSCSVWVLRRDSISAHVLEWITNKFTVGPFVDLI